MAKTVNGVKTEFGMSEDEQSIKKTPPTPPDNLTTTKQQQVDTVNGEATPNGEDKEPKKADPHHIMQKTEKTYTEKFNNPDYDLMTGLKTQIGGNNLQDPTPNYPSVINKPSPSEMHQEALLFKKNQQENKARVLLGLKPITKAFEMVSGSNKPKSNIDQSPMKKYIKPAPKKK